MGYDHIYMVVFGAAVRPDGSPSGTLRRRVDGAFRASHDYENVTFVVTGGLGEYAPSEAKVMAELLVAKGVPVARILQDDLSGDTLESIYRTRAIIKNDKERDSHVVVCTSPYHAWRCQVLYRLVDIQAKRAKMPSDRPALGVLKWLYYYARECIALPWDVFLLLRERSKIR